MIEGTCLCGSVSWQLDGKPDGATACNCTACRRYGVLWAYGYVDEDIKTQGETKAMSGARHLSFTSVQTVAAWHFGVGYKRMKQVKHASL